MIILVTCAERRCNRPRRLERTIGLSTCVEQRCAVGRRASMASSDGAPDKRDFGRLLRRYREHAGLGQERLAERAGMSAPAISNLERGVSRPRLETVTLLAEALALPAEQRGALLAAALGERTTPPPSPP